MHRKISDVCIARSTCKLHNIACSETCVGFTEISYQLSLSNIPMRFREIGGQPASVATAYTLLRDSGCPSALEYREAARSVLGGSERGLYLWSATTGTGKSTVATALGVYYIVTRVGQALRNGQAKSSAYVYYVSAPMFLERVKQMYSHDDDSVINEVNDIQRRIVEAELLIFDDVGITYASESVQERLLALIEARYSKPTCYTSNCSLNQLEDRLGQRIVSRIYGTTTEVHVKGLDYRRERDEA